ncbi:MAG: serine/threonine-protein phosphatase 6 regulatory ankyrin repeat subunit B-like isoform, partial [Pedosphaera sp.]|nr:serine/threonine-protein phosphatase 6 regulatory ankyrin repeat subunit B-like isoform [Pedosphaera sp.]
GGWDMDEAGTNAPFQLLLKSKANVNAQDNQGMTPLHVVAASESTFKKEATKALLEAGANPNLRDKQGRTAVHLFLGGKWPWSEARECIALLVSAGADLSLKDESGKTLLHYLAAMGNQTPLFFVRGITNTLAANKADLMVRDNEGNTPLHVAAKTGTYDVLDWLVKRGADLDATNNAGETPRILMARNPDPFARVGAQSAETDIFQAVREGKVDAAARLVAADPQLVNQTNQVRQTPLRLAVVLHRTNMMDFLEAHGAKWDETTAVLAGRRDALQAILKEKPSAVDTMEFGKGLIHIAASKGDMDTVKILIAANCDIQAVDNWGMSALGRALVDKHKEVQELLRQHGARENFFDAIYANDLPTVTTLLAQDRSLVSARNRGNVAAMDIAAAAGYTDILKLLLKQHADMDSATSANSRTPLHLAAFYNQTNTLALLIRQGAKVNQVDALGFAPLHWATIRGAKEAAAMLLNLKADANQAVTQSGHNDNMMMGPNRGNLIGDTPLHLAALCGETNIVQLLLKSKADVNATNAIFQTPLDLTTGQRPMNPFGIFMVQRGMLVLLEPLGVNQGLEKANRTGQSTAAALIEAAGGKQNHQQLRGRPAFAYPN